MLTHPCRLVLLVLLIGGGGAEASRAQAVSGESASGEAPFCQREGPERSLDVRGLAGVYCTDAPAVKVALRGAHTSARPVFFGAVPAAWLRAGFLWSEDAAAQAYTLTLSQGVTYGVVVGLKRTVGRPRPYVNRALDARIERYDAVEDGEAYVSFPSGHASLSAAIVTSWSLTYPRWYVIAPGAVWATGVGLSRLYLGVHYPSDVLTGTMLGAGVAVLVHHLRRVLVPSALNRTSERGGAMAVPVGFRIRF